ncbi:MAG TPA: hypothetical protein PLO28_14370, partial [bacterium]|nr:hypothetical protein [bacterium]
SIEGISCFHLDHSAARGRHSRAFGLQNSRLAGRSLGFSFIASRYDLKNHISSTRIRGCCPKKAIMARSESGLQPRAAAGCKSGSDQDRINMN